MKFLSKVVCILAAGFAQPAISAVISFDFTARIDEPASPVTVGTLLTGSFSYDDSLLPSGGGSASNDAFYSLDPSIRLIINTPSGAITSTNAYAGVTNDFVDGDEIYDSFFLFGSDSNYNFGISFYDPSAVAFGNAVLPAGFPSLYQEVIADQNDDDDLTVPFASLSYYNIFSTQQVNASVLSITRAGGQGPSAPGGSTAGAVPEPASWAMMIAGFGLVGCALRRRQYRLEALRA